ncbi:MAG: hypothetical protein ACLPYY_13485 [Acidimicrobiales bacterium]
MSLEDRESIRAYYNEMGDAEWRRLEETPRGRVSLEVHRRFLARFLDHEVAACAERGAVDGGTHILFAARSTE